MAQSDEEKWLQYAEEYGSPLEDQNKVVVVEEKDIDNTMSIPGLQYNIDPTTSTRAIPLRYVQLHLSSLFRKISAMLQTVTNAVSDLAQIKTETNAAKDAANQAASNANAKAILADTAASNADTSRQAIEQNESTRQSNESKRQQNETTRSRNEQSRVSAETLRAQQATNDHQQYLSDTQQAGQDHNRAVQDHNTADTDHTLAGQDHDTALQDHETASGDHDTALQDHHDATDAIEASETQTDIAEEYNQHPPYIGNDNYWYLYNTTTHAYVRAAYAKGNDLDYSTMTPEEVQMLIDNIKADLIVASVETCESIIDELT